MPADQTIISPASPGPDRAGAAQAERQRAAQDRATRRFNAIAVTLIASVTLLSAVAALLQNDAANRQSSAARDMQRYAASQLSAALQSQQAQNFDAAVQRDWLNLAYERSLLLDSGTVTRRRARRSAGRTDAPHRRLQPDAARAVLERSDRRARSICRATTPIRNTNPPTGSSAARPPR